jgi:hypothetical protein
LIASTMSAWQRHAPHAVESDGVDQVLRPQDADELSTVDLRHEHAAVLPQDLAEIRRERREVPEVDAGDGLALPPGPPRPLR